MSIWATWLALADDEHETDCAIYRQNPPGSRIFHFSGEPCDCGIPRAPIVYEGSHILPCDGDRRGGDVDVAAIPDFITRDGRDDAPAGALKDWLRLSVRNVPSTYQRGGKPYTPSGDAVVLLDRPLVEELRDTLTAWLERKETV